MGERVRVFLEEVIGIKSYISAAPKLVTIFDAISYIDSLGKEMRTVHVVEPFWSLEYNKISLFLS
jgi:hypothetical protein